jgi:hypothetical protein
MRTTSKPGRRNLQEDNVNSCSFQAIYEFLFAILDYLFKNVEVVVV